MQRHMTRPLYECLYILIPRTNNQFSHRIQFCKLGFVIGIGNTSRAKSVTQRNSDIILSENITNIIKMLIKKTFLVMNQAPFTHNATAPAHNTAQTFISQMYIVSTYPGMNRKVIHPLFTLLNQGIFINLPTKVFHLAVYFLQCLIDRYSTYRNRTITYNPFTGFMDIISRR